MHLLQTLYANGRDGIEQVALNYTRGLVATGVRVTLVCDLPDAVAETHREAGAVVIRDARIRSLARSFDPEALWFYRAFMRRSGVGAVIVHNGRSATLFRRCREPGIPIVSVCHVENLKRRADADVVVCLNRDQAERVRTMRGDEVGVVQLPNPLTIDGNPAARPDRPRGRATIGTLGRLAHEKGVDVLIEALSDLRAKGTPADLVIGGTGPDGEALRSKVRALGLGDHVRFIGAVDDRPAFFAGLDVFVSPSRRETFGLVVAEAMVSGVPVIATATEGSREIVDHDVTGLLVRPEDPRAMAEAIASLVADPDRAGSFAAAATPRVRRTCDRDHIARSLLDAIGRWRASWDVGGVRVRASRVSA